MNNTEQLLSETKPNLALIPNGLSTLGLAYLGDAAFELYVRSYVTARSSAPVNILNRQARKLVSAVAQAKMYFAIEPCLTDEELAVIKRGRNAKSATTAKNASVTDYRHATGLETLFGYLYINNRTERMTELFNICLTAVVE